MKREILFRRVKYPDGDIEQLVVPDGYKGDILKGLDDHVGHPGIERTLRLMRERFFWPGMPTDVEE